MSDDNYIETEQEDGSIDQVSLYDIVQFENEEYAVLKIKDAEDTFYVSRFDRAMNGMLSMIDNEDDFNRVCGYIQRIMFDETSKNELYKVLDDEKFKRGSYKVHDLGEGMAVVHESMWGWWKPRYLVNHNTKCAYEFIDNKQKLLTVTEDDIDWDSLKGLPEKAIDRAKSLSFHFPSFIREFKNGVAQVSWELNPDGRYYMDDDGFGMTDDEEIDIYGFIDCNGKVVVKFRYINNCYSELAKMRKIAEKIVKSRKSKRSR